MANVISHFARKYGAVIFFPTFSAVTIYADWSHTRNWKRQQKESLKAKELIEQE